MSGRRAALALAALALLACDPIAGSGSGKVPAAARFLVVDDASRSAVLTLIAGHPATDNQFNYNGYANGELAVKLPVGWKLDVQCENRGTVPNSCAVVTDGRATEPLRPDWSTPDPARGLKHGESASFEMVADAPAHLRIASLVGGHEASGMWMRLEVVEGGRPAISGTSSSG